jgi:hypothetical protein
MQFEKLLLIFLMLKYTKKHCDRQKNPPKWWVNFWKIIYLCGLEV